MYFRSKNSRQERVWVKVWVKKAERENLFFKKKTNVKTKISCVNIACLCNLGLTLF